MRLKTLFVLGLVLLALAAIAFTVPWASIAHWASVQQREFQNAMALALQKIKAGDTVALWTLCVATASYGFVHALGPGHGKVLLGGAALASGATLRRMITLSMIASLAQSLVAILIVAVLVKTAKIASGDAIEMTETWLVPLSYFAIIMIGALLVVRGLKEVLKMKRSLAHDNSHLHNSHHDHNHSHSHDHDHDHDHSHNHHDHARCSSCGHSHGVSLEQVQSLTTSKEAAALIGSIAIRPCTGALFLLVIAARFDIFWAGVLATLTMGFGTASFNIITACSGVAARQLAFLGNASSNSSARSLSAGLHIIGGLLVSTLSLVALLPFLIT